MIQSSQITWHHLFLINNRQNKIKTTISNHHTCLIKKEPPVSNISGFPEWLPEQRIIELKWMDEIRRVFESYGFCSIETPSVEEIDALLAKGETDKEIYVLTRLQADDDKSDARLGLHYDLTVPLARYVAEHYNNLVFPFKR